VGKEDTYDAPIPMFNVAHTCGEALEADDTYHVRLPRTNEQGAVVVENHTMASAVQLPSTVMTVRPLCSASQGGGAALCVVSSLHKNPNPNQQASRLLNNQITCSNYYTPVPARVQTCVPF
jgi:hypothetical protein